MIAIVDYKAGNLKSVEKAMLSLGQDVTVTESPDAILSADKIILPGVGAFGDAMKNLTASGLDDVLREAAGRGIPLLGICLGMQLLFEESEESPGVKGLGLLPGRILRIPAADGLKIPHMGWNNLIIAPGKRLYDSVPDGAYVYFVHSYYLKSADPRQVAARCDYGVSIDASVEAGNLYGCQFHPEKSGDIGLRILSNFAAGC
jgi:glutamine amidotransferase